MLRMVNSAKGTTRPIQGSSMLHSAFRDTTRPSFPQKTYNLNFTMSPGSSSKWLWIRLSFSRGVAFSEFGFDSSSLFPSPPLSPRDGDALPWAGVASSRASLSPVRDVKVLKSTGRVGDLDLAAGDTQESSRTRYGSVWRRCCEGFGAVSEVWTGHMSGRVMGACGWDGPFCSDDRSPNTKQVVPSTFITILGSVHGSIPALLSVNLKGERVCVCVCQHLFQRNAAGDQAGYIVAWSTKLAMYPRIWK